MLQAAGNYYLVTVGATTAAIDGITTWVAGDWISSNGTIWQRVQNSTSPYLPLTGGTASGQIAAPSFGAGANDVWTCATIEPGFVWSIREVPATLRWRSTGRAVLDWRHRCAGER